LQGYYLFFNDGKKVEKTTAAFPQKDKAAATNVAFI